MVLRPEKVPTAAPMITSLAQCRSSYMRERPTIAAPPYRIGPKNHLVRGHHCDVSSDTAAAAANAAVECPDGNDWKSPLFVPRMIAKLLGFVSLEMYGRARPSSTFSAPETTCPTTTASVPWRPSSAARCTPETRPTTNMLPPIRYGPG